MKIRIYIIKAGACLFVCQHYNVKTSLEGMGYPRVPMALLWPCRGNKPNCSDIE